MEFEKLLKVSSPELIDDSTKRDLTHEKESLVEVFDEKEMVSYLKSDDGHTDLEDTPDLRPQLFDKPEVIANYDGILRGYYGTRNRPRWCPKQSKFGARGGRHNGVDIAMLKGTPLLSLVNGRMQYNPRGSGTSLGNHIWLNFKHNGNNYTLVYAHLDNKIGSAPRNVSAGEEVAISGCSGNTTYCGTDNCIGTREDHVHVVLYGPSGLMDPVSFIGWNLQYYNDNDCFYYNC